MRDRTAADDAVMGAYNRALLALILPPMRLAAKEAGYALAVHGSLDRDIDLIAVPWVTHNVWSKEALRDALVGAIRGVVGRCHVPKNEWTEKPHGRVATCLLAWCGNTTADIDLSIMPCLEPKS